MTRMAGPRGSSATCSPADTKKRGRPGAASSQQHRKNGLVAGLPTMTQPRGRRRGAGHNGLVLLEARQALRVQLRIADRPAFPAHPRMPERKVAFEQAVVMPALDDVAT